MRSLIIESEHIDRGELILVNDRNPFRHTVNMRWMLPAKEEYADIRIDKRAVVKLHELIQTIHAEDDIIPISGFRDYDEQMQIYEDCLRTEGIGYTTDFVALPGCSEHHTGLAIDLAEKKDEVDEICPDFPYQGICQQFRERAADYGFIERYQKGKEAITHVAQEPWHFRYVGVPHAKIIYEKNITLEEYIDYLKQFTQKGDHLFQIAAGIKYEIFYIPLPSKERCELSLLEEKRCIVSGNNIDGVIVTIW